MLWALRSLRRCLSDSPVQTLQRLLLHRSALSLSQLNEGLSEVVKQYQTSEADRNALASPQSVALTKEVTTGMGELEAEGLVAFCQWQSQAAKHRFGWHEVQAADKDKLTERLQDLTQRKVLTSLQLQSLLQSLSELKNPALKFVSDAIEERLAAPDATWTTPEILDLLSRLANINKRSRKMMDSTSRRVRAIDFRQLDTVTLVKYYESLCNVELFYHNKRYTDYVDRVALHLLGKAKDAEESVLTSLLKAHFGLKFHRVHWGKQLLAMLSVRLDVPPSPHFLCSTIRLLVSLQESDKALIPPDLGKKLFAEAAKLLPGMSDEEQEAVFSAVQSMVPCMPAALVHATRHLAAHCSSRLWLVAAARALEASQEDASFLLTELPSLLREIPNYSPEARLTLLSSIYSKRGVSPFELLESTILSTFEAIFKSEPAAALRIVGRLVKHNNNLLKEKLDYMRTEALKLMSLPWPQELATYWLLYLGFFVCKGNEREWTKALQANTSRIKFGDLEQAADLLEDADDCEPSVVLTLESIQSCLSPEALVLSHKFLNKNSDSRLVQRYVQLLNRIDPNQVSRSVLLASLSNITKLVLAHSLHPALPAFIPALQRLRAVLP